MGIVRQHIALSAQLFRRYGLALSAVWAAGMLLDQILLRLAVEVGLLNRLAGLVALSLVVLLQLLIFVAMFVIPRNGLPRLRLRRRAAPPQGAAPAADGGVFTIAVLAVLIPFYGYYAGWGLLGDTLRSYSQIFYNTQMARIDLTRPDRSGAALEIGQTGWVVLAVAVIWAIRRFAKSMNGRSASGVWPMLVVTCEATWALLGLYVISGWQDDFAAWLASLPSPRMILDWIIGPAAAAVTEAARLPVDWPPAFRLWPFLTALFWYALLPLIWFNLGAIVYGHDLNSLQAPTRRIAGQALNRWQALPKPLTDFIGHFWAGMVKRWHAVTNGVLLAASAGFVLTCSVIVAWRLVDWLGNWAWVGASALIGPRDLLTWKVLAAVLNALFGAPGASAGGLLVSPLQFCILAAGLELAGRAQEAALTTAADAAPA